MGAPRYVRPTITLGLYNILNTPWTRREVLHLLKGSFNSPSVYYIRDTPFACSRHRSLYCPPIPSRHLMVTMQGQP